MIRTPSKAKAQCVLWEVSALSLLVFFAVFVIVSGVEDWSLLKNIVVSVVATCSILWCVWVVRTFRDIMHWWIHIQEKMETVNTLLVEARQEIKELKLIKQGK